MFVHENITKIEWIVSTCFFLSLSSLDFAAISIVLSMQRNNATDTTYLERHKCWQHFIAFSVLKSCQQKKKIDSRQFLTKKKQHFQRFDDEWGIVDVPKKNIHNICTKPYIYNAPFALHHKDSIHCSKHVPLTRALLFLAVIHTPPHTIPWTKVNGLLCGWSSFPWIIEYCTCFHC